MIDNHASNHLPDGKQLSAAAPPVLRFEPVEATLLVVRHPLLGKQHREAVFVGEFTPPGAFVNVVSGLAASVQNDEKGRALTKPPGHEFQHPKIARIAAEMLRIAKPGGEGGRSKRDIIRVWMAWPWRAPAGANVFEDGSKLLHGTLSAVEV